MNSCRYRIVLDGAVQGVGFRPFVYRLASSLDLSGYVQNSTDGLVIEVEGERDRVDRFMTRLGRERPSVALVTREDVSTIAPLGSTRLLDYRQRAVRLAAHGRSERSRDVRRLPA
jgi:hydrogenase maturation protein HypF